MTKNDSGAAVSASCLPIGADPNAYATETVEITELGPSKVEPSVY